jgi:hypothetical protein
VIAHARPPAGAALAAGNHPVDPGQVKARQRAEKRLKRKEPGSRRRRAEVAGAAHPVVGCGERIEHVGHDHWRKAVLAIDLQVLCGALDLDLCDPEGLNLVGQQVNAVVDDRHRHEQFGAACQGQLSGRDGGSFDAEIVCSHWFSFSWRLAGSGSGSCSPACPAAGLAVRSRR